MPRLSLLLIAMVLVLSGCPGNVRPAKPQVVEVPGPTRFVPIDAKLTSHPPLPPLVSTGPLQCPAVANERLDLLGEAYRQLDAIKAVQGTNKP